MFFLVPWVALAKLNARKGSLEPSLYSWLVESTGDNMELPLASEGGCSLVGLSPSSVGSNAVSR